MGLDLIEKAPLHLESLVLPAAPLGGPAVPTPDEPQPRWVRFRTLCREAFSEFFGTFILILFGNGVDAQVVLSGGTKGDYQSINWGWAIGVFLGVYTSQKSGAHINPAVTFANCVLGRFPWRKLPVYAIAQVLGAMTAAAVVFGDYRSAISAFEGGSNTLTVTGTTATAGIYCTYPQPFLSRTGMFFDEFLASAILMFCIYACLDNGAGNLMPLCLFFIVFGIGCAWGWLTGYAINPARDFGPRLMSYMAGYGTEVWSAGGYYFWIPIVAPMLGCVSGGFIYDLFLYEGKESPANMPSLGLARMVSSKREVERRPSTGKQSGDSMV